MATASPAQASRRALVEDALGVTNGLLKAMNDVATLTKLAGASEEKKDAFSRKRLDLELMRVRLINDKLSSYQAELDTHTKVLREATSKLSKKLETIKSIANLLDAATSLLSVLAKIFI